MLSWLWPYVIIPATPGDLAVFYLFWISFFLGVNVIWDVFTSRTPAFHLDRFKEKGDVLFSAASFCSSILIIVSFMSANVRDLSRDTMIPLILAGCSGLIRAVPALCPYKSSAGQGE